MRPLEKKAGRLGATSKEVQAKNGQCGLIVTRSIAELYDPKSWLMLRISNSGQLFWEQKSPLPSTCRPPLLRVSYTGTRKLRQRERRAKTTSSLHSALYPRSRLKRLPKPLPKGPDGSSSICNQNSPTQRDWSSGPRRPITRP